MSKMSPFQDGEIMLQVSVHRLNRIQFYRLDHNLKKNIEQRDGKISNKTGKMIYLYRTTLTLFKRGLRQEPVLKTHYDTL